MKKLNNIDINSKAYNELYQDIITVGEYKI